jgi:hypothetical protein
MEIMLLILGFHHGSLLMLILTSGLHHVGMASGDYVMAVHAASILRTSTHMEVA